MQTACSTLTGYFGKIVSQSFTIVPTEGELALVWGRGLRIFPLLLPSSELKTMLPKLAVLVFRFNFHFSLLRLLVGGSRGPAEIMTQN